MAEADRESWDARYRERRDDPREPSGFLVAIDDLLPRLGRAIDLAGGDGRHALRLASRGLDVTLADISEVALAMARDRAESVGLSIRTLAIDLEAEPIPPGPWDLVVCIHYLWRPLLESIPATLAPGGRLVVVHPTRSNLQRHPRPGARHLLDDGELPGLVRGLEIVRYDEGWQDDGRHEARLVGQRSPPATPYHPNPLKFWCLLPYDRVGRPTGGRRQSG